MIFSTESQRRLIWHGMFLFLLGLLMGFAKGQVINPRMALAAHHQSGQKWIMSQSRFKIAVATG
jgi:hypothetical protein